MRATNLEVFRFGSLGAPTTKAAAPPASAPRPRVIASKASNGASHDAIETKALTTTNSAKIEPVRARQNVDMSDVEVDVPLTKRAKTAGQVAAIMTLGICTLTGALWAGLAMGGPFAIIGVIVGLLAGAILGGHVTGPAAAWLYSDDTTDSVNANQMTANASNEH